MIGHTEATVPGPVLRIVELNVRRDRARNQHERDLEREIVQRLSKASQRDTSDDRERKNCPDHLLNPSRQGAKSNYQSTEVY